MLLLGGVLGLCNAAVFEDLKVWGGGSIVAAVFFVVCAIGTGITRSTIKAADTGAAVEEEKNGKE